MKHKYYVEAQTNFMIEFFDIDPMQIVWHGNYAKYMEKARCVLLDKIGYNYFDMAKSGYSFPVVDMKIKYLRPLHFHDNATIKAYLTEYENCIRIDYEIYNNDTGTLCTKAQSTQMCVLSATQETQFVLPKQFLDAVGKCMAAQELPPDLVQ